MFQNFKECAKNYLIKINLKEILMFLLLVAICIVQYNQSKKIRVISNYLNIPKFDELKVRKHFSNRLNMQPRKELIGNVRGEFLNNLNEEMRNMDIIKERIQNEMSEYFDDSNPDFDDLYTKNYQNGNLNKIDSNSNVSLQIEDNYDEKGKIYTINIKLPEDFSENDVNFSIDDGTLYLEISKHENTTSKNKKFEESFYLNKVITLPKTKAKLENIKKIYKNGIVTIVIPIL